MSKLNILIASSCLVVVLTLLSRLTSRRTTGSSAHSLRGTLQIESNVTLDDLYSDEAVNYFCAIAQNIIAHTTNLNAQVVLLEDLRGFQTSNPTPYKGKENLPLTIPQYIAYGRDDFTGEIYPQGIWCKLKTFDGLNEVYPDLGATKGSCNDINLVIFDAVLSRLSDSERIAVSEVSFDTWPTYSVLQWKSPNAYAYRHTQDTDTLRLVAKEMEVPSDVPYPQQPEKKGVQYCQIPSAEYIRRMLSGKSKAPVCEQFPDYPRNYPYKATPWMCRPQFAKRDRYKKRLEMLHNKKVPRADSFDRL